MADPRSRSRRGWLTRVLVQSTLIENTGAEFPKNSQFAPTMTTSAFSTLCSAPTQIEAEMIISLLRSEGLHPMDLGTNAYGPPGGGSMFYSIRVPTAELATAQELMKTQE